MTVLHLNGKTSHCDPFLWPNLLQGRTFYFKSIFTNLLTKFLTTELIYSKFLQTLTDKISEYRIFSRISLEILDKIWPKFYQFDLYTGHKQYLPKCTKTFSCVFQDLLFTKIKLLNFQILDIFFQFNLYEGRLIRGSTYTRVYKVVYYSECRYVLGRG